MAVAIGTVTTGALNNASTTTTISFTSTNQPLYLIVPFWRSARTLNTVKFNTVDLARVAQSVPSNGDDAVEIWRLLTPTATTANVVLTFSGTGQSGSVAIFNTTGQHTSTPEGTAVTNKSTVNATATGNLAVTTAAAGDLTIVGIVVGNGAAVTPANTGGTGLTEFMDVASNGEGSEAFRIADAVTQVAGSWTGSTAWGIAAIPLKVAAAATKAPPPYARPWRYSTRRRIA